MTMRRAICGGAAAAALVRMATACGVDGAGTDSVLDGGTTSTSPSPTSTVAVPPSDGDAPSDASTSTDAASGDADADAEGPGDGSVFDDAADSFDGSDGAPARFVPTYFDINHVLSTGQSLSVGSQGTTILSNTQPFANLMPNTGVRGPITGTQADLTGLVPLVESVTETMGSGLANWATELAETTDLVGLPSPQDKHVILVSGHGIGGYSYARLKKGGTSTAYANGIKQVTEAKRLADEAGKSYVVRVVTNVHGESDHTSANLSYKDNLFEWQSNYETDVKAITGQTSPVPMLHTQFSSWTKLAGSKTTSTVAMAQLQASIEKPDELPLVGAKYFLPYVTDGVHLTSEGYRWMGEYYAKVYRHVVVQGKRWVPVRPKSAFVVGAEVIVDFHVPSPPLVIDTTAVSDPGHYGFEYTDDSGAPPAITSVAITAPTTVTLRLSAAPTGGNRHVRYAYTGIAGAKGGATTGPRGNLRDSDPSLSRSGNTLYDWAVHFDYAIP